MEQKGFKTWRKQDKSKDVRRRNRKRKNAKRRRKEWEWIETKKIYQKGI
jgi:hypothetical protein